jgi:hypothetical protein
MSNASNVMKAALAIKRESGIQKSPSKSGKEPSEVIKAGGRQQFAFIPTKTPWVTETMTKEEVFELALGCTKVSKSDFLKVYESQVTAKIEEFVSTLSRERKEMSKSNFSCGTYGSVPEDIKAKMDRVRTFHVNKKMWKVYNNMVDVLDERIEDAEDKLNKLEDGKKFARYVKRWILLKFDRMKYEKLEELAEISFKFPAKAHGCFEAKGLLGWFANALSVLDFCEAVGGLECKLSKEEEDMVSDEEEEEEEEEEMSSEDEEDDMSDVDESEYRPRSPEYAPRSPEYAPRSPEYAPRSPVYDLTLED